MQLSDVVWAVPVVRASDAHLYPAWWPKIAAADWHRTVQEARTATFVPDLGLVAELVACAHGRCWRRGHAA